MAESRLLQVLGILGARRQRRRRNARSAGRVVQISSAILLAMVGSAAALAALAAPALLAYITNDLPAMEALPELLDPKSGALLQPTHLYDRNGEWAFSVAPPGLETRRFIHASDNPYLAVAFLAAFDPGFLSRGNFDAGFGIRPDGLAEKLVGELLLGDEAEGWRKTLRTRLLAAQTVQRYGREQLFSWALNSADFGRFVYGADNAARYYLGKAATQLSLGEAALLAATALHPEDNPFDAPQTALLRQQALLLAMQSMGLLSEDQAIAALAADVDPLPVQPALNASLDAFSSHALQELIEGLGAGRVGRGGLDVITTLDLGLQQFLESLLANDPEAEVVVLDPGSGQVLAMIGPAQAQGHSTGTVLSPFVYLAAFASGLGPASLSWDLPSNLLPDLPAYGNPNGEFHGPISLRDALANNYLVPTVQLLAQFGPQRALQIAREAGMRSLEWESDEGAWQLLLGGGELPLIEIAQAYGVLASEGQLLGFQVDDVLQPSTLLLARGPQSEILLHADAPDGHAITSRELAFLVNHVLSDAGARRDPDQADALMDLGRPAALQIGFSQNSEEAIAIAYSPQIVVALWTPERERTESLWPALFEAAHRERTIQIWSQPPGLSNIIVCLPSGLLPSRDCPQTRSELFLAGQEPSHVDELYQRLAVNKFNGRLATVFTPPAFIEERLFLVPPAEALAWAADNGLPLPPTEWDHILPAGDQTSNPTLQAPTAFSTVQGTATIRGTVGGEGFESYRVLVGKGLYPQQWTLIAEGRQPTSQQQLAVWDSRGLDGIYAIQLAALFEDGSMQSAYSLVTVDNQAPEIEILNPAEGESLNAAQLKNFRFQAQASDNLQIAFVEFILDGRSIGIIEQAPYEISWTPALGQHRLRITVQDLAGQRSSAELSFEVLP